MNPENELLIKRLAEQPERVRAAAANLFLTKEALAAAERDLERKRQALALIVASEQNPDGKKRYSNQEARDAAVAALLEQDAEARGLVERIDGNRAAVARNSIDLDYERDVLDAARATARILGGRDA
ncbi:MAG: hypothetical protein ACYDCK_01535 [Thermoplasmatota archaeon]